MPKEKTVTTKINKWLKAQRFTAAVEYKVCERLFPFRDLRIHQENALKAARYTTLVHKLPDTGYYNPFDVVSLSGVPAYLCVYYHESKRFYFIPIEEITRLRDTGKRSLSEDDAALSAEYSDTL